MPAEEYTEIVKEIASRLSGDKEKDLEFLSEQISKYKNHEYAREIIKAIGRLISQRQPENSRQLIERGLIDLKQFKHTILSDAQEKIKEKKLDEAERLLNEILPYNDNSYNDKVSEYFCFNNLVEFLYFHKKFTPSKEIRRHPTADVFVYFLYGYIYLEKKDYIKALEMLDKGLKLNPLDTKLLFEKAEIFKARKDWNTFKDLTDDCIEYAYKPVDLAKAYRNYGYMFIEKEDYEGAIACYMCSLSWDSDATMASSQLFYISQTINQVIDEKYYQENLDRILKDRHIHSGPNKEILAIIYSVAKELFENDKLDQARDYYKLFYDFVGSEDIYAKIQSIDGTLKGRDCPFLSLK